MTVDSFRVPDVIGEIVGYRAWRIVGPEQTPRLKSVTYGGGDDQIWPTNRWFPALCSGESTCQYDAKYGPAQPGMRPPGDENGNDDDSIPGVDCGCGLYAARSISQLVSMSYAGASVGNSTVIGEVGFVGKVIGGTQGWRAERGRIVRLWVPIDDYARGLLLGRAYGVDVEVAQWDKGKFRTLDEMVAEHETKEAS